MLVKLAISSLYHISTYYRKQKGKSVKLHDDTETNLLLLVESFIGQLKMTYTFYSIPVKT